MDATKSIFDLEDDIKMELGYIGEYVEYNMAAKRRQDELEQRWLDRAPWEQKGQYPRDYDTQRY